MRTSRPYLFALLTLAALAAPAFVACSSDDDSTAGPTASATSSGTAQAVTITLNDSGCDPRDLALKPGAVTFKVTNSGSSGVTEFEILDEADKVLGEIENITPGIERDFSMTLEAGTFVTYCPGGETERGTLTVSG